MRLSTVLNAAIVLVVALVQLPVDGRQTDHEDVRPWGCRTCPVPQTPDPQPSVGAGLGADAATPVSARLARAAQTPLCDGDCPAYVEMLLAACQACPSEAGAASLAR